MTTAIQARNGAALTSSATNLLNLSLQDTLQLGAVLARSGYFKDTRDEAQAVAKILYGRELGIGPMAAMMGIHIIEGKPAPSANLIATLIQRSGRFAYRVRDWDERICRIEFFEHGESVGVASFSIQEAQQAKVASKDNWSKYPKAMLFSRTISQGARAYCPAVFGGAPVYTPDELGAEVTVDATTGEILVAPDPAPELPPGRAESHSPTRPAAEPTPSTAPALTPDQQATIRNAVAALGWGAPDCTAYLKQFGVARFGELSQEQAAEVIPDLLSKAAEIEAA